MTGAEPGPVLLLHLLLLLHAPAESLSARPRRPARYYGQIAENSPAGTPVQGVLLPDGAGGCPGADLNASLTGEYASDFRLIRHRGDRPGHLGHLGHLGLVSARALDREFIAMYELTVELPPRCRGRPAAVRVEVSDRNDNVPRFTRANQTVEADELTPLGTELARFDATDGDAQGNGRVRFYAAPESHLLHVVPQTGQLRLVGSLLGLSRVTLRLLARDGGEVARVGEPAFLRVEVRRSGGAPPPRRARALTEELTYTVTVPDHVGVRDLVFTVPDRRFERRWFEVVSEADPPVRIERDSGRLYLTRGLPEPAEVLVKIHNAQGKRSGFCSGSMLLVSQWIWFHLHAEYRCSAMFVTKPRFTGQQFSPGKGQRSAV